jgi:hypothetical protein
MIPAEYKQDVIQSGINFMRSITEAYGTDEGMKLWDNIASVLDPDVKGQIFFAMLTGEFNGMLTLSGCSPGSNRVARIKAIRSVTSPNLGLKEAKDISDLVDSGKPTKININPKYRSTAINELRDAGFYV